jgi:carbon storage regulator
MLVLSRKIGECLVIGDNVVVQVLAVRRGQIRLGITAPDSVSIRRAELPRHPRGRQPNSQERHEPASTPLTEEEHDHVHLEESVAAGR